MNARFEFGKNFLEIKKFNYFPDVPYPPNTLFDLCVQSRNGNFIGVGECEDDIIAIRRLADELREMYELKRDSVEYRDFFGYGSEIDFILYKTGRITVVGTVTAFDHSMEFEFGADQTALPKFINELNGLLKPFD